MASNRLTASELLDRDLAIRIVAAPVIVLGFAVLVVVGAFNDWRARG